MARSDPAFNLGGGGGGLGGHYIFNINFFYCYVHEVVPVRPEERGVGTIPNGLGLLGGPDFVDTYIYQQKKRGDMSNETAVENGIEEELDLAT